MKTIKGWLKNHKEEVKDVCAATVSAVAVYSLITNKYRDTEATGNKFKKFFNKKQRA